MGLDMYLSKKIYLRWNFEHRREGVQLPDWKAYGINSDRVTYVEEKGIYWRKANAIHRWFVDNIQKGVDDCKDYFVSIDDLKKLLVTVEKVLEDHTLARELLPTCEGFFFGSTEYDEYYWGGLVATKENIEKLLKELETSKDIELYYHSSW